MRAAALTPVLALLALAGCRRDDADAEAPGWNEPPTMAAAEQQRGVTACEVYVTRLCRCADSTPALAPRCELARAQPEALAMSLSMLNGEDGRWGHKELLAVQANARRIIRECFEADVALDPMTCPR
jgi:hypothetical protein